MAESKSEMVQFGANGRQTDGYLARPATEPAPGVIVVQEWWELNENIKAIADRFAAEGFVALAPDLYHGKLTSEPDEARKLLMELDRERALVDLAGAAAHLRSLGCPKVGAVGYCMGGGLVLEASTRAGLIDAAAPYYGRPLPPERAAEAQAPISGYFGGKDHGISVEAVNAMADALAAAGKDAVVTIYPEADHAFFNDTRPESYDAAASADAWASTVAFFWRTLDDASGVAAGAAHG